MHDDYDDDGGGDDDDDDDDDDEMCICMITMPSLTYQWRQLS